MYFQQIGLLNNPYYIRRCLKFTSIATDLQLLALETVHTHMWVCKYFSLVKVYEVPVVKVYII
jgi:hypothetical protein